MKNILRLSLLLILLLSTGHVAYGDQEYKLNLVASTRHGPSYSVAIHDGYAYVTGNDGITIQISGKTYAFDPNPNELTPLKVNSTHQKYYIAMSTIFTEPT